MLLECCFQQPRWLRHGVGSFSFCGSKKILIYHVAATMTLCSSATRLRLEMYLSISDEVQLGVVMKLWYIMINHWWEAQMVPTTPATGPGMFAWVLPSFWRRVALVSGRHCLERSFFHSVLAGAGANILYCSNCTPLYHEPHGRSRSRIQSPANQKFWFL